MVKVKVMIIDDHALVRDAWTIMLQSEGRFNIIDAISNGAEVEERIGVQHPDIVLLDINMAPLDGFAILDIIRKVSPATKVIAVSMHDQTVYVKRMIRAGASGYVTKNSSSGELSLAIDVVLKGGRYICKEVRNALAELALGLKRSNIENLTAREIEVIRCMREGLSSKQIAERLSLTVKTVEAHRHNILKKLDVNNSISVIELANSYGL
jgi:two-component system invasion response regulator UvrY